MAHITCGVTLPIWVGWEMDTFLLVLVDRLQRREGPEQVGRDRMVFKHALYSPQTRCLSLVRRFDSYAIVASTLKTLVSSLTRTYIEPMDGAQADSGRQKPMQETHFFPTPHSSHGARVTENAHSY